MVRGDIDHMRQGVSRTDTQASLRILKALLHVAIVAILQWAYLNGIAEVFASDGYARILGIGTEEFDWNRTLVAWAAVFVLAMSIKPSSRPSEFFLQIMLASSLSPILVLFASRNVPANFVVASIAAFLVVSLVSRLGPIKFAQSPAISSKSMLITSTGMLFAFVGSFLAFGGFSYLNFDITQVYDFRVDAAENLPDAYAYLTSAVTKALIPFAMTMACVHRALWLALVIGACSILLFALTANKAPLFFPLVVLWVYYIYPRGRISLSFLLAVLAAAIVGAIALQAYLANGSSLGLWTAALIGNRAFMLPSLITYAYYDQFADGIQYWWSESRLTLGLVPRPFAEASPRLIGLNYFGRIEVFANTGWIGSGYAQAGIYGAMLYSFCIGIVFLVIDGFAHKFGPRTTISMFIILVLTMITTADFVVMFLTHGMILGFLLARFTKRPNPKTG